MRKARDLDGVREVVRAVILVAAAVVTAWGVLARHPRLGFQPLREVAPYSLTRECRGGVSEDVGHVYALLAPTYGGGGRGIETNDIMRLWAHVVRVERRRGERCQATLRFDRGRGAESLEYGPRPQAFEDEPRGD